jgi:hypothetical protein
LVDDEILEEDEFQNVVASLDDYPSLLGPCVGLLLAKVGFY